MIASKSEMPACTPYAIVVAGTAAPARGAEPVVKESKLLS